MLGLLFVFAETLSFKSVTRRSGALQKKQRQVSSHSNCNARGAEPLLVPNRDFQPQIEVHKGLGAEGICQRMRLKVSEYHFGSKIEQSLSRSLSGGPGRPLYDGGHFEQ